MQFPWANAEAWRQLTRAVSLYLLLFAGSILGAQQETASGEPVARTVNEYFQIPIEIRERGMILEWDCAVTFYDPFWNLLFIQDSEGSGAYVNSGKIPLPINSGDRVQVRVETAPGATWPDFSGATFRPGGKARIEPVNVGWSSTYLESLAATPIRMEALVERIERNDTNHIRLVLSAFGTRFGGWLLESGDTLLPDWEGKIVSITGVYNPRSEKRKVYQTRELMISSRDDVRVVSTLAEDSRFSRPVTPVRALERVPTDELVRVVGRVTAQEPEVNVQIRDDTGQVSALTAQLAHFTVNQTVEAIGYPQVQGTSWNLRSAFVRPLGVDAEIVRPAIKEPLQVAADVMELAPADAAAGKRVLLTGVVTWSHPKAPFFFVQDSSRGIAVWRGSMSADVRPPGEYIEVAGKTRLGDVSSAVEATDWKTLATQSLPVATKVSLDQARSGAVEAQWVEILGHVRSHEPSVEGARLRVGTPAGTFEAVVSGAVPDGGWCGDVVRLQGVCSATPGPEYSLPKVTLRVPSRDQVLVVEERPVNPFGAPLRSLSEIASYGSFQTTYRRQRAQGVVFMVDGSHRLHLADGGASLEVDVRLGHDAKIGDRVEVVGFLNREQDVLILADADLKKIGTGKLPDPVSLTGIFKEDAAHDGQLGKLTARVVDRSFLPESVRLSVTSGRDVYDLHLPTDNASFARNVEVGGTVEAVGLLDVNRSSSGQITSAQIFLRNDRDLRVIESGPWLTERRVLVLVSALSLLTAGSLGWVTFLSRRVTQQTDQIREQREREAQLEADLERASRLESLGHLAGGIAHDFNNLLTVMMGNLSIVRYDVELPASTAQALHEAEMATARAKDLTQQLLTFAKGGAPICAATRLPDIVREVGDFALAGSRVKQTYRFSETLWHANVDRGQIGQVVQNLVLNAVQAMPNGGRLDVSLENAQVGAEMGAALLPGYYVKLEFRDSGAGIAPEDLRHIFDPYFTTKSGGHGLGLATVHSIVKRHQGHITVESRLGEGSIFRLWLPALPDADGELVPATPTQIVPPSRATRRTRVLFMDDEPQIRQTGGELLSRLGYQVALAADGAEAIQLYREARAKAQGFDIVILDLTIPGGMGGRDTLTELKKLDPEVKAIVSSGYSNDAVLAEYRRHGFAGMVSKPYEIADLSHTIDRVVRGEPA